jgi:hypothetical protein
VAVLSILLTTPLGAIGIMITGEKWLELVVLSKIKHRERIPRSLVLYLRIEGFAAGSFNKLFPDTKLIKYFI